MILARSTCFNFLQITIHQHRIPREVTEDLPESFEDLPEIKQILPDSVEDLPDSVEDIPGISKTMQYITESGESETIVYIDPNIVVIINYNQTRIIFFFKYVQLL